MSGAPTLAAPVPRARRGDVPPPRVRLALGVLLVVAAAVLLGPLLYAIQPNAVDLARALAPPSPGAPLGTDEIGRDVLARLLAGGRVSLLVALVAGGFALAIGVAVGAAAGLYGGTVDAVFMRLTDAVLAMPLFFFLLLVLAIFGQGVLTLALAIGAVNWMDIARVVRADVLQNRAKDYVTAAQVAGAGPLEVLRRHLVPQAAPAIFVALVIAVSRGVLAEGALSYIGLGVQPPAASWGGMLTNAQTYVRAAPHLAVFPGLAILLVVWSLSAVGDHLGELFDPRRSRGRAR